MGKRAWLATRGRSPHSARMNPILINEILLFGLPVVVITLALLWSIARSIDRVARKLERLTEVIEKSTSKSKD
jgi:hypothetical protein